MTPRPLPLPLRGRRCGQVCVSRVRVRKGLAMTPSHSLFRVYSEQLVKTQTLAFVVSAGRVGSPTRFVYTCAIALRARRSCAHRAQSLSSPVVRAHRPPRCLPTRNSFAATPRNGSGLLSRALPPAVAGQIARQRKRYQRRTPNGPVCNAGASNCFRRAAVALPVAGRIQKTCDIVIH